MNVLVSRQASSAFLSTVQLSLDHRMQLNEKGIEAEIAANSGQFKIPADKK
jgi:hypothetical protein